MKKNYYIKYNKIKKDPNTLEFFKHFYDFSYDNNCKEIPNYNQCTTRINGLSLMQIKQLVQIDNKYDSYHLESLFNPIRAVLVAIENDNIETINFITIWNKSIKEEHQIQSQLKNKFYVENISLHHSQDNQNENDNNVDEEKVIDSSPQKNEEALRKEVFKLKYVQIAYGKLEDYTKLQYQDFFTSCHGMTIPQLNAVKNLHNNILDKTYEIDTALNDMPSYLKNEQTRLHTEQEKINIFSNLFKCRNSHIYNNGVEYITENFLRHYTQNKLNDNSIVNEDQVDTVYTDSDVLNENSFGQDEPNIPLNENELDNASHNEALQIPFYHSKYFWGSMISFYGMVGGTIWMGIECYISSKKMFSTKYIGVRESLALSVVVLSLLCFSYSVYQYKSQHNPLQMDDNEDRNPGLPR